MPAFRQLRQKHDLEFEASLGYRASCLKQQQKSTQLWCVPVVPALGD